jgi:hypothetical protein
LQAALVAGDFHEADGFTDERISSLAFERALDPSDVDAAHLRDKPADAGFHLDVGAGGPFQELGELLQRDARRQLLGCGGAARQADACNEETRQNGWAMHGLSRE